MANDSGKNPGGRPLKYETLEEMQEAIDWYFDPENPDGAYDDVGDAKLYHPTMAGLARSVGLSRQGLLNYSKKEKFFDALKEARARVEEALEKRLYGQSVTGVIFNLKNNFGWQDKQDLNHSSEDGSMTPTQVMLVAPKKSQDDDDSDD